MTEFANLLRTWRERVRPEEAGLPGGAARRTPGLRREELAMLAGISVDYVVRLEQGRATHPSAQMLGALARALRLSDDERDHLFRIADVAPPSREEVPRHIAPGVQRLVDRLGDTPVSVHSAAWDILLVNQFWITLFGDPATQSRLERNIPWQQFVRGIHQVQFDDRHAAEFDADLAADLRAAVRRYPRDRGLATLVARLRAESPRFEALWSSAHVAEHRSTRKTIIGTPVGSIDVDCDVLAVPGHDLKIVVYSAIPGTEDASKLDLLRVAGRMAAPVG